MKYVPTSDLEKLDPVRLSKIARVLLVRPIIPMLMYTEAAASDAVAFRIIERLRRWVVRQSRFAQVVIGIRDIREIGPFRCQKIEAHRIDRYAVERHENTIWPRIIERRHLPFAVRRAIHIVVSVEPIDKKKHGFLAEILMTQKIGECG